MNEANQTPPSDGGPGRRAESMTPQRSIKLPATILRYVLDSSAHHQALLSLITVTVFLIELVPLELQRRIVNDLVKHRDYRLVIVLCAD